MAALFHAYIYIWYYVSVVKSGGLGDTLIKFLIPRKCSGVFFIAVQGPIKMP